MNVSYIVVTFIGIVLIGYLIAQENRNTHRLRLRAKKMRAGPMFQELLPLLRSLRAHSLEQLRVEPDGLTIRLLQPAGEELRYRFAEHGYPDLSPERQEALLMLMEDALPKLADGSRYHLRHRRRKLLNGKYESVFTYIIDTDYKVALSRAPYYDGTLRTSSHELL